MYRAAPKKMPEVNVATSSGIMAYYTLCAVQARWITQTSSSASGSGSRAAARDPAHPKAKKSLLLAYLCSGVIIGLLNILVDIGVPAEKEVIQ